MFQVNPITTKTELSKMLKKVVHKNMNMCWKQWITTTTTAKLKDMEEQRAERKDRCSTTLLQRVQTIGERYTRSCLYLGMPSLETILIKVLRRICGLLWAVWTDDGLKSYLISPRKIAQKVATLFLRNRFSPKSQQNIWATFVRQFVAKNW